MKKYNSFTIKIFLSLLILFSLCTAVRAADYELIIITPSKYETIAQQFLVLHGDGSAWTINGVYARVEDIFARYDQQPDDVEEPTLSAAPDVATPGVDEIGEDYENEISRRIIKFLRGILQFRQAGQEDDIIGDSNRRAYEFAFDVLRDSTGTLVPIGDWYLPDEGYQGSKLPKFHYLLLLGETGAAGPASVTFNGVPESWYIYIDPETYGDEIGDGSVFPTDFFYSSPDYYDGVDWTPNLIVGRLPIHNLRADSDNGTITEVTIIEEEERINTFGFPTGSLEECDVCDSTKTWTGSQWQGYELWIVSDGNPPDAGKLAPVGATYLILDNNDSCLRVLGNPDADGVEVEDASDPLAIIPGDGYEIHDTALYQEATDIYNKCAAYDAAIKADSSAWDHWYRKVVTAGGDSHPTLFSFWDEFVLAEITNQGYFEGNEITKLRHTTTLDADMFNDFDTVSVGPYLNDTDCGLLFLLGGHDITNNIHYIDSLLLDDTNITSANLLATYTSTDNRIPIMVSNTAGHACFDFVTYGASGPPYSAYPSFGEAAVETIGIGTTGGAIAFIGADHIAYTGIIPFFDNGIVYQDRLFNMDELLSYTMESFHAAPKYLGDIFAGTPDIIASGGGPINRFIASNIDYVLNDNLYWFTHKTVWEYTLLGDPCLPVPYPAVDPIDTATSAPTLALSSLRSQTPQYESHDIGVDEIPDGGSASTTVNITTRDGADPVRAVPRVKITRVDVRRDTWEETVDDGTVHTPYTFNTPNAVPGYYFVRVEQPGWDGTTPGSGSWGSWFEKEHWIYVQEVNEFVPTTSNILVVDDDCGYPIVTQRYMFANGGSVLSVHTDGYEDWYLKSLEDLGESYDIWHVDYDDNLFNGITPPNHTGDNWSGTDMGNALMHGEVYTGLLNDYDKVIWLTGDPSGYWRPNDFLHRTEGVSIWNIETLTSHEQTRLTNYLNDEGRLFLSGQGILSDLGCSGLTEPHAEDRFCERRSDGAGIQNAFLTTSLRITDLYSAVARGYHPQLKSVSQNPVIIDDYTFNIAGADGAENQFIFVDAEPNVDTPVVSRVFEYTSLSGAPEDIGIAPFFGTAGTAYYRGRGAHIFLPWGFEAIAEQLDRNQVMTAVIAWLDDPTRTGAGEEDEEDGDGDGDGDGGGGGGADSLDGCFIATACYGTPMSVEVKALSHFRDEYLMTNSLGRFFVTNYYRFSPYVAEYISQRPALKKFVRTGLKPLVHLCEELIEK
ncbi:MAG: C25 family cysteine peptidase [Candidatus Ratteibacteria bacterium]|nr:C25 family cysteine peptidase [Candidatus Ratteibacteria bacterium]